MPVMSLLAHTSGTFAIGGELPVHRLGFGATNVAERGAIGMGRLLGSSSAIAAVAARHGATEAQVAFAWLLHRSPIIVPIPGTGSLAHLRENVGAAAIELSEDDLAMLHGA